MLESFRLFHCVNDLGVLNCELGNTTRLWRLRKSRLLEPGNATFRKNLADFYYAAISGLKRHSALTKKPCPDPRDTETLLILETSGGIR